MSQSVSSETVTVAVAIAVAVRAKTRVETTGRCVGHQGEKDELQMCKHTVSRSRCSVDWVYMCALVYEAARVVGQEFTLI